MSSQSVGNRVQEDLTQAVASGKLPDDVHTRAEQLLARLRQPVRIALMGMPKSGKSTLLNLLVGSDVLPDDVRLPTLQLSYGDTLQTICTLPDGSKSTLDHADGPAIAVLEPVFVEMQMPLPALGKISVLEVVAPADPAGLQRAMHWGAKRSDVTLWCTQGFGTVEQALWGQMPDIIKDHAFLMITKADILAANGMLDAAVGAVRTLASEEFNQILPIATKEAIGARQTDGTVDKTQMRSSGGLALISAVLKQVEQGRQSAVDMADVLLLQHADVLDLPAPEAAPASKESQTPPPADTTPETAIETPAPTPDVAPAEPEEAAQDTGALKPATRDAYEYAVTHLVSEGRALIDQVGDLGDAAPGQIMSKSVEQLQWLSDYLNENGDEADPALERARNAAMDAADLVQLMQMEKRDSAAIEALSLMIQIKRELQADLAA